MNKVDHIAIVGSRTLDNNEKNIFLQKKRFDFYQKLATFFQSSPLSGCSNIRIATSAVRQKFTTVGFSRWSMYIENAKKKLTAFVRRTSNASAYHGSRFGIIIQQKKSRRLLKKRCTKETYV